MSDLAVRRAYLVDLAALVPLFDGYRQFYQQPADLAGAEAFLRERLERDQSVVFLAFAGAQAVGFTQLFPTFTSAGMARVYVLNDLFVTPAVRGRGAGRALLQAAADWAFAEAAVRLSLSTAHDNLAAQRLYEASGWVRDEVFRTYTLRP